MTPEPTGDLAVGHIGINSSLWRKSSWSNFNGSCVEVAQPCADRTFVRDSKDKPGGVLLFTAGPWAEFMTGIKAGMFDL
jgi:hypothetical protein